MGSGPPSGVALVNGQATVTFGEKVATLQSYQYGGKQGRFHWHKKVKNYLISQSTEMEHVPRQVELRDDGAATARELILRPSLRVLSLEQIESMSRALWAFPVFRFTGEASLCGGQRQRA